MALHRGPAPWPCTLTLHLDPAPWPRTVALHLGPESWPRTVVLHLGPESSEILARAQLVVLLSAYAAVTTDFGPADIPEDQWPGACAGVGTCEERYARASQKVDNAGVDEILYRSRPG